MRPRMLIAEGDHAWRRGLRVLFANRGWEVTSASTVAEGLALLDPPPDFLILDWALSDGSGGAILRRVREEGLKTRVAVTTAADAPDYLSDVKALKPEAILARPISVADLWREAIQPFSSGQQGTVRPSPDPLAPSRTFSYPSRQLHMTRPSGCGGTLIASSYDNIHTCTKTC